MNFLAHLFLSGADDLVKFGNFIGDSVKGKSYENFEPNIRAGILMHREIDRFTDSHPIVKQCNTLFRETYGKYAGVVTDIVFDHFLAANWTDYSNESLENFVKNVEKIIETNFDKIPPEAALFVRQFMKHKRMMCYQNLDCLHDVFTKMAQFTSLPSGADAALAVIRTNYPNLRSNFQTFFKDIQIHILQYSNIYSQNI